MIGAFGNNMYSINLATGSGQTIPIANVYLGHIHVWPDGTPPVTGYTFIVTPSAVTTDESGKTIIFRVWTDSPQWSVTPSESWIHYIGTTAISQYEFDVEVWIDATIYGDNTIIYVSTNDSAVTPYSSTVFGANIVSNIYLPNEDYGLILFDNNVTMIGYRAFYGCSTLLSITIPDSVTTIGKDAFRYCSALSSVTIPDSVTSIGDYAFEFCQALSSITIPDSVTTIGDGAFEGCQALSSITIPDGVTTIGGSAFYYCRALSSVIIGSGVTTIGGSAFYYCYVLSSITIPDSVTTIGDSAFTYCRTLSSITIPDSVTSIGKDVFVWCYSLSSITVDSRNTVYDSRNNCNAIIKTSTNELVVGCYTTVIPNTVTSIGANAFEGCRALTGITIPDGVTTIGGSAFYYCRALSSITVEAVTPPTLLGSDVFYETNNCPIYVPAASVTAYQTASGWSTYASRIQAIP